MHDPRRQICDIAKLTYDRFLTDAAGGNLSVRSDDKIFCTPRYAGSRWQWNIHPEHIVVTDMQGCQIEGSGELSREYDMHKAIYQAFEEVGAVLHAHPRDILVFASMERPIPPTLEQTDIYGTVELCEKYASHTPELAISVVRTLAKKRTDLPHQPIACLIPRHGITIAGTDLKSCYDMLERLEGSCHILISRAILQNSVF